MNNKSRFAVLAALLVLSWGIIGAGPQSLTVDSIGSQLMCPCGCGLTVISCNHDVCGPRDAILASVRQQIGQGRSEKQIIDSQVAQYGEVVLAAPTKEGFNLTAWVTPFAALLVGAVVIYFALRAWVFQGRKPVPQRLRINEAEQDEYRKRLDRELEEFSRKGDWT